MWHRTQFISKTSVRLFFWGGGEIDISQQYLDGWERKGPVSSKPVRTVEGSDLVPETWGPTKREGHSISTQLVMLVASVCACTYELTSGAALELVVGIGLWGDSVQAGGLLANGGSGELHQVLTAAGLRGGQHCSLLPARELHLRHGCTNSCRRFPTSDNASWFLLEFFKSTCRMHYKMSLEWTPTEACDRWYSFISGNTGFTASFHP